MRQEDASKHCGLARSRLRRQLFWSELFAKRALHPASVHCMLFEAMRLTPPSKQHQADFTNCCKPCQEFARPLAQGEWNRISTCTDPRTRLSKKNDRKLGAPTTRFNHWRGS